MAKYRCIVCNWVYDDAKEKVKFTDLPKEWVCPICGAPKSAFVLLAEEKVEKEAKPEKKIESTVSDVLINQIAVWGVKYVFGIPGTSTLGIVDAIRKTGSTSGCRSNGTIALSLSGVNFCSGNNNIYTRVQPAE